MRDITLSGHPRRENAGALRAARDVYRVKCGIGAMEYKFREEIAIRSCRIRRFMSPDISEISTRGDGNDDDHDDDDGSALKYTT